MVAHLLSCHLDQGSKLLCRRLGHLRNCHSHVDSTCSGQNRVSIRDDLLINLQLGCPVRGLVPGRVVSTQDLLRLKRVANYAASSQDVHFDANISLEEEFNAKSYTQSVKV